MRQAGGLEIRDRLREGLVPAERGPEQLEGEVLERQAALEEPQHPHPSQGVFAGSRMGARGAQHLARRHPDRNEPRARQGVGPIDAHQLAPQRVRHTAARHQRGAIGQRALGRQIGDGARPVARIPENGHRHWRDSIGGAAARRQTPGAIDGAGVPAYGEGDAEADPPVFVDGALKLTLKGDRIVAEFLGILEEDVERRYARPR